MKITMKRLLLIILTMAAFTPLKAQNDYKIITGQFEKGAPQVQEAFAQLFGEDGTKEKFDFYFHWYNIPHEFGHCILDFYGRSVGKVREEMLANRFAVAYWKSAGYSKELAELKEMLEERELSMQMAALGIRTGGTSGGFGKEEIKKFADCFCSVVRKKSNNG